MDSDLGPLKEVKSNFFKLFLRIPEENSAERKSILTVKNLKILIKKKD